jgi:hypothetical protein
VIAGGARIIRPGHKLSGTLLFQVEVARRHAVVTLGRLRELAAQGIPASRSAQLALADLLSFRSESRHEAARLVERGWDDGAAYGGGDFRGTAVIMAILALVQIDELNRAHALGEATLADAQARGSVAAIGRRGWVGLRRGDLAEADIRAAFERPPNTTGPSALPFTPPTWA